MANVATTIAMDPTYQPFERPPDPSSLWSVIPRGLRGFIVRLGTLDAKPVNDTQTFVLNGTLGANFAYVLAEISIRLTQDRAADWDRSYTLNLQNFYQGGVTLSNSWSYPFRAATLGQVELINGPGTVRQPKAPMFSPVGAAGILVNINGFNPTATVATAGTISGYINFWEFDREQARKYPINAPFPTHSR